MPETADTELQFPANFLKSFEISIQRRQNFSISCNNLVKLAMSFSTHHFWKNNDQSRVYIANLRIMQYTVNSVRKKESGASFTFE